MDLWLSLTLLLFSSVGFWYGVIKNVKKKSALFKLLITAAIGCIMLGQVYECVTLLITGTLPKVFHIGMLSSIGGFMFIFSASYAQMDGLVDDRGKGMEKYRILALLAPLAIGLLYLPIALSALSLPEKLVSGLVFVFLALASYYNLKHLIIPDVTFGIIASIRPYSFCSLLSLLLAGVQMMAKKLMLPDTVIIVTTALLALSYPLIVISVERGSKKWII